VQPEVPVAPGHSLDLDAMDRTVKPGADFFLFANGGWYGKAEIPADRASTGVDFRLEELAEQRTKDLLEAAAAAKADAGSDTQRIGDFYASFLDEAAIEARGIQVMHKVLDRIAKLADKKALSALLGSQLRADVDPLNTSNFYTDHVLGLWVEQDLNDPTRYAPYLLQGGLGMPDRSYYLDDAAPMAAHRAKYQAHLATMLRLAGVKDPDGKAARVFAFEKRLAAVHAPREDSEDVTKGNNPWARADFATRAKGLDWDAFFKAAGLDAPTSFIVWHPSAVTGLAALVKSEPLQTWKDYLTARALDHAAAFLPKAFVDESFAFYGQDLRGVPAQLPRWKKAIELTNESLGFAVGKAYVGKYFPPEAKHAIENLVQNVVTAFGKRIDALDWMTSATKAKAQEKLSTLKVGVGYPDTWKSYDGLNVVRGEALADFGRAELFEYRSQVKKLGQPVDRGEWAMLPQIVNACNLPVRNALNFPAGNLVPPYFDANNTAAANYGAIGAIIGHEVSHSFDDQGCQFDAHGRVTNWWTPDDLSKFQAAATALAAQFSEYKPFPDVSVNGKLTLSENIADLAGLAAAYDAWRASLAGAPAPTQDGLTGDQQFFLAYAQAWQFKQREQSERAHLAIDGHAPPHYRVWTVRNVDAWVGAFDVKPDDPMYLPPTARVRVW
jgi:putative endopeptidase